LELVVKAIYPLNFYSGSPVYSATQSRRHGGAFGGLAPPNKAPSPPKLNHETL